MKQAQRIDGFSLIELLVTVVILSVGLLGLAGMQITGLRSVNNASTYTQATLAMNDIVERMRANPNALYLVTDSAADIDCTVMPNPYCSEYHNGANEVIAGVCTGAQMAAFDLNVWFCGQNIGGGVRTGGVSQTFPQAAVTIDNGGAACTPGIACDISLSWQDLNPDRNDVDGDGVIDNTIPRTFNLTMVP